MELLVETIITMENNFWRKDGEFFLNMVRHLTFRLQWEAHDFYFHCLKTFVMAFITICLILELLKYLSPKLDFEILKNGVKVSYILLFYQTSFVCSTFPVNILVLNYLNIKTVSAYGEKNSKRGLTAWRREGKFSELGV